MVEIAPGTGYELDPTHVERPELQFLFDYWKQKSAGRRMPSRADLVIRDLKNQLGWIALLDVLPGSADFRYRLIGTNIARYFRRDSTGMTVAESFAPVPQASAIMLGLLSTVASKGLVVRTWGNLAWMGNGFEDFESLYLPFSDDGVVVNMIMNPFVYDRASSLKHTGGSSL